MAAGDLHFYESFKEGQYDGTVTNLPADLDVTDACRCALVTSTYSPNLATHVDFADITNEVSGTGYTAGGETITLTVTNSSGTVTVDTTDVVWSQNAGGFTDAYYCIIYVYNATAGNAPLICYGELGANKGNTTGSLTLQWAGTGLWTLSGGA